MQLALYVTAIVIVSSVLVYVIALVIDRSVEV